MSDDDAPSSLDFICPDCNCACERDYTRRPLTLPPFAGTKSTNMLVRIPVLRCPICRETYTAPDTMDTVAAAVREACDRQMQPTLGREERIERERDRYMRLAYFWNGVKFATEISIVAAMALASILSPAGSFGRWCWMLNALIWIGNAGITYHLTFCGMTWVDRIFNVRAKRFRDQEMKSAESSSLDSS